MFIITAWVWKSQWSFQHSVFLINICYLRVFLENSEETVQWPFSNFHKLKIQNHVNLPKIFSASNVFMYIFQMSVTYLQTIKKFKESSKRSWYHNVCTIIECAYVRKWVSSKPNKMVNKNISLQQQNSLCTPLLCLNHICIVMKKIKESFESRWFQKLCEKARKWQSSKPCKFP